MGRKAPDGPTPPAGWVTQASEQVSVGRDTGAELPRGWDGAAPGSKAGQDAGAGAPRRGLAGAGAGPVPSSNRAERLAAVGGGVTW